MDKSYHNYTRSISGSIIKLCQDKRGVQTNCYSGNRAVLSYELPLNEVVFDFNDRIKSMTSGYASFDYEIIEHREGDLVKLGPQNGELRCISYDDS